MPDLIQTETLIFNGASKKYQIYLNMIVLLRLNGNFENLETREWKKRWHKNDNMWITRCNAR